MPRLKLTLSYDGTKYCGWQVQANAPSIQATLQKAIETICRHKIDLTGSGRTDSGVHANGQTAHLDTSIELPHSRFCLSVNALLPEDIRLLKAEWVEPSFHARYSAKRKIYHYHLHPSPILDPFSRFYSTPVFGPFSLSLLHDASRLLLGTHDFTSFANESENGVAARDPIRTLYRLDLIEEDPKVRLEFEGDGFLYKMVRNMVGTLLEIAAKKRPVEDISRILHAKNRRQAGGTAPAKGLFLYEVIY